MSNPHGLFHAVGNVMQVEGPGKARGILDHHPFAVSRSQPDKRQRHDRAEGMTSQDIHRPWQLGQDVLSKVIDGQLLRAGIMP